MAVLEPGDKLGRFRVEALLGHGSFGAVYRAHDPLVGERVALKVLRAELSRDPVQLERLRREVLLARRVDHPGVCRIHDLQQDDDTLYVVMEHVEGHSLDAELKRGALPPARAARIVEGVCRALAAAHAAGVLHRDVKPANVMVHEASDEIRLLDFGIATTAGLDHLTKPGVAIGTLGFLAPELWEGKAATPLTDVFAAGVLLYGALTATLPWRGAGLALVQQMRSVAPAPPSVLAPGVNAKLDAIVLRAIAVSAKERTSSAAALADELCDWLVDDVTTEHVRPPARTSELPTLASEDVAALRQVSPQRTPLLIAAAGMVVGIAGLAVWLVRTAPEPSPVAAAPEPALDVAPSSAQASVLPGVLPNVAPPDVVAAPLPSPERTPDAAVDHSSQRSAPDDDARKTATLRTELARLLERRGLVAGDVPLVDQALRARGKDARTQATLKGALDAAAHLEVDRAFVERKLARLQARAGGTTSPKLNELAGEIAADIAAARYLEANARLNRALALVGG